MLRLLYRLLLILAYPLVRLRLRWRALREPEYGQRVEERFGYVGSELPRGAIWFHTVSAGETISAAPLVRALVGEFPDQPFLVTTMTPSGSAQVNQHLHGCVAHCYAPYDFRPGVERFFARLKPRLLVLMETELWPNLIDVAYQRRVPVLLINARLSARSARGYARVGSLTRTMLGQLKFIACQYPEHVRRFVELGANAKQVKTVGNVKFDVQLPGGFADRVAALRDAWELRGRPVWIAASTHQGEEEVMIEAHRALRRTYPRACLLLVPRHPVRAAAVERLVNAAGLSVARQSAGLGMPGRELDVVLCDTMGQLQYLYGVSQVAFIGGSLAKVGGHNPIEAAVCRQPVIMGPEVFNFPDVVAAFADAGCLSLVRDAQALARRLGALFADDEGRKRLGDATSQVVAQNAGATERLRALLRAEIQAS